MDNLEQIIMRCRALIENEHFVESTNLIYDYRTSRDHEHRFDHLPTPEEIAERKPNPCGWSAGQEDSMINGGVAMDMYIDANDTVWARKIYQGLKLCGTISGVPGFLARSVSPRDGKSFYPESSRDQYTHYVYALWHYFNSDISTSEEKAEIVVLLTDVAKFCEKYITEENDYTLPRADFGLPRSSVCKLWNVNAHEMARLPMFYAAAYSVSGDPHWLDMCYKYAAEAAERSIKLGDRSYNAFALMQMMYSCSLIYNVIPDAALKQRYNEVMLAVDEYFNFNFCRAADDSYRVNFAADMNDWRKSTHATVIPGCRHMLPEKPADYQLAYRILRDIGEALIATMLMPEPNVSRLRKSIFRFILEQLDVENHMSYAPIYSVAAWYKARKLNIEL